MLPSGRLGLAQGDVYDRGRTEFLRLHARAEVDRWTQRFTGLWSEREEDRPPELDELDQAVKAEFGLTLTDLVHFQIALISVGNSHPGEPKVADLPVLLAELEEELGWERASVEKAFDLHVLQPREAFLSPEGHEAWMVFPWRFNRDLSYVRRPLLLRETDGRTEIVWGTRHAYEASRYFFGLCTGGRLRATTAEMRNMLNRWRATEAREFNERVAAIYAMASNVIVRTRVTSFAGLRLERVPGELITDIDVLVIEPTKRRLLIVETKALAPARTPHELAYEREKTFHGVGGKRSEIDKLLDATDWVKQHRKEVLAAHGLPTKDSSRWRVRPLMVLETELLTPFLSKLPVDVLTLAELERGSHSIQQERPVRRPDRSP